MKVAGGVITCIVLAVALGCIFMYTPNIPVLTEGVREQFATALWRHRVLDVIGQLLMMLAGTFGVLVLVKERIEH